MYLVSWMPLEKAVVGYVVGGGRNLFPPSAFPKASLEYMRTELCLYETSGNIDYGMHM